MRGIVSGILSSIQGRQPLQGRLSAFRKHGKPRHPDVCYVIGIGADDKPERVSSAVFRRDMKIIEGKNWIGRITGNTEGGSIFAKFENMYEDAPEPRSAEKQRGEESGGTSGQRTTGSLH